MPLSSTSVVIWWIANFWKKICCISMWQSTLLNKCKEDTDSHFFYSLRKQPKFPDWLKFASTNQREQPRSGCCRVISMFFSAHFSQTSFRVDGVANCWLLSQALSFKFSCCCYSFFVVFLVCVISWCDVCLSVFLQESSENPNPLAKAELNLLAHLVGGANKKTESKLIPKIQNKIRFSCLISLLQK